MESASHAAFCSQEDAMKSKEIRSLSKKINALGCPTTRAMQWLHLPNDHKVALAG